MKRLIFIVGICLVLVWSAHVIAAETYTIDPAHSSLGFTIKHMMVSNVTGGFGKFEGAITFDPKNLKTFQATATIQASSIDTRVTQRDEHLKGPEFFEVDRFPTITFVGRSLLGIQGKYTLTGDLTIKGVTKAVTFPVEIAGPTGVQGGEIMGLSGDLTINRQDYGVSYNKVLDQGGYAIGNEVKITVNIEAKK